MITLVVCPTCKRSVRALTKRSGECPRCTFTTVSPPKQKPSKLQRDLDKLAREITRAIRREER